MEKLGQLLAGAVLACAAGSSLVGCDGPAVDQQVGTVDEALKLDDALPRALAKVGFTGRIAESLEARLGRPVNPTIANIGRLLFFDKIGGLRGDNSCAGCHAPTNGFGDTQPIAIGIMNNDIVGPHRQGPRNQRRSPSVINTAFYPAMMWTARFFSPTGDPFHSAQGFVFPPPEGTVTGEPTLIAAQASIPATELTEVGGFRGLCQWGVMDERYCLFDDGQGDPLPPPAEDGTFNAGIQTIIDARLAANPVYMALFREAFGDGLSMLTMRRRAIAEFEASLTFADAPLDRYARGERQALSESQKRGALLFFGKADCVSCHAVSGKANEMFSDFERHRIGAPQLAPAFGLGTGDVIYDGADENEDFGFAQTSGDTKDRYMFRTAPLRNLKVAPAFFHDGSVNTIEAAIRHHQDPLAFLASYDPTANGVPSDLRPCPPDHMLDMGLDPKLHAAHLADSEIADLADFIENGLFDARAQDLCDLVPASVPSGRSLQRFEGCPR